MTFIAPHYQKAKKKALLPFFRQDHFLVKTPWWLRKIVSGLFMGYAREGKKLYLSFDDGPHPTITPFILNELRKYNAKATFFCIGENVVKYPDVYRQLLEEGHTTGNHTQHHINGWKSADDHYLEDIKEATAFIESPLFRPPYGRISRSQIRKLKQEGYKDRDWSIVMWNILAGDWVQELSPEKCYQRIGERSGQEILLYSTIVKKPGTG